MISIRMNGDDKGDEPVRQGHSALWLSYVHDRIGNGIGDNGFGMPFGAAPLSSTGRRQASLFGPLRALSPGQRSQSQEGPTRSPRRFHACQAAQRRARHRRRCAACRASRKRHDAQFRRPVHGSTNGRAARIPAHRPQVAPHAAIRSGSPSSGPRLTRATQAMHMPRSPPATARMPPLVASADRVSSRLPNSPSPC